IPVRGTSSERWRGAAAHRRIAAPLRRTLDPAQCRPLGNGTSHHLEALSLSRRRDSEAGCWPACGRVRGRDRRPRDDPSPADPYFLPGAFATCGQLARFAHALWEEKLLNPAYTRLTLSAHHLPRHHARQPPRLAARGR